MLLSNYNDTVLYIIITLRQQKIVIGKIIDKPFQTFISNCVFNNVSLHFLVLASLQ